MKTRQLFKAARKFRKDYCLQGGVVLIYNGQIYGWKDKVRSPCSEKPGAVAIDERGNRWIAAGGDPYNGAEKWEPISRGAEQHDQ
ncbi:hypothetical protein [Pseudohongiella spirulinae]|uniref:ArdR protein n=1 Tax=Pseudohongiella spirulinae TaxID=1249552 RepID=A0A0S2KE72_9GAMM|nr:hypothetical protein [Pseudohongiella spirulinae]ALO46600.1 ArdR protein [Pseudohongiella spirulinae]